MNCVFVRTILQYDQALRQPDEELKIGGLTPNLAEKPER
jgi:hypothetical protein